MTVQLIDANSGASPGFNTKVPHGAGSNEVPQGQSAAATLLFEHFSQASVSLSRNGRCYALCCFAAALTATSVMALMLGAWPVVPFAGLELLLLWLAFRIVAAREGNFEHIEIDANELRFAKRIGLQTQQVSYHLPWVRLQTFYRGSEACIQLFYRGEVVEIGTHLDQLGRKSLRNALARWMRFERLN